MDNDNLNVCHLAWCGLIALNTAWQDGIATSPAQENLFLTRWLLREGRGKGVHADLPGKLDYLWRAGNGNLLAQNDLFRYTSASGVAAAGTRRKKTVRHKVNLCARSATTPGTPM